MTTTLLDGNVLVALTVDDHVHHAAAESWMATLDGRFATCPITQGTLVRLLVRQGQTAETSKAVVTALTGHASHELWPDDISYSEVTLDSVIGHRQVTDAYLAHLARAHGGRLASFDQGLVKTYADVVDLVPTS